MAQLVGGGSYASSWGTSTKKTPQYLTYNPWAGLTPAEIRAKESAKPAQVNPVVQSRINPVVKGFTQRTPVTPYTPPVTPVVQQQQGGGGFDFSAMMKGYQPTQWQPPGLPQEPQVTQQMLLDWQARAKNEAGMQFDPQLLAMQQEFEKMMLAAEQAKGGLDQPYQDIIDYVENWQKEELGATQRRTYARGLGQGGGLIEEEGKIGERALKEVTAAGTERARKLGDIEEQKLLLMEQSGAKREEIEVQKGRYVAARSADLEDSYVQNKRQLEQQKFANLMEISKIGMTKEAEDFNRWLGTMSLANEVWYQEQTLGLERESMNLSAAAQAEAAAYRSSQGSKDPYENMIKDPKTGLWITWEQWNKNQPTPDDDWWSKYEKEMAELAKKQREKEYSLTTLGDAGYTSPYSSSGYKAGQVAGRQ